MTGDNNKETSIIPISSTDLVRVGNSIAITNKIIKEHEQRIIISKLDTVKIGNQEWMIKNLDEDRYRNGDPIPLVTDATVWGTLTIGAYCFYNNNPENATKYGKLYNWHAVNDPRGLAPAGWHIPSDAEWISLADCLGGYESAGRAMKETGTSHWTHWKHKDAYATNSSGFTGLPCGSRSGTGDTFTNIGEWGHWWSSTEDSISKAWYCSLYYREGRLYRNNYFVKRLGFSVRCLRD